MNCGYVNDHETAQQLTHPKTEIPNLAVAQGLSKFPGTDSLTTTGDVSLHSQKAFVQCISVEDYGHQLTLKTPSHLSESWGPYEKHRGCTDTPYFAEQRCVWMPFTHLFANQFDDTGN